jgi:hypothetical protein
VVQRINERTFHRADFVMNYGGEQQIARGQALTGILA